MMDVSLATDDPYEAERAAKERALNAELQELADRYDRASLERRYELHRALIWLVWAMGTARGQNHAEQAVAIARRLQDQRREAEALHEWARVYLYEHGDVTGDDVHPTREESHTGQQLHEEALQIRERLLGPDHPDVAESLMRIVSQGRLWAPMEPYLAMAERAVQIYERAFGPENERTCAALEQLAMLLRFRSDYDRSLAIYEGLLAIYTRVFGPEEHHTQNTLAQIAWTHQALGNNTAAAALMRDQLARQRSALGDYDPSVLSLIVQISDLLRKQGQVAEADAEIAQTLARLEAELGYDHPSTLTFLSLVGGHYIGLASPPEVWTPAYADLFRAIAHALHAYAAQPFARAVWETLQPGVYLTCSQFSGAGQQRARPKQHYAKLRTARRAPGTR